MKGGDDEPNRVQMCFGSHHTPMYVFFASFDTTCIYILFRYDHDWQGTTADEGGQRRTITTTDNYDNGGEQGSNDDFLFGPR
jgi:hypothetical protein